MSDEDQYSDLDSDDSEYSDLYHPASSKSAATDGASGSSLHSNQGSRHSGTTEKRAHHNALERKRRDQMKEMFNGLRDAVPTLRGKKDASRAQILKKTTEFIRHTMKKRDELRKEDEKEGRRNNMVQARLNMMLKEIKDIEEGTVREDVGLNTDESDTCDSEDYSIPTKKPNRTKTDPHET